MTTNLAEFNDKFRVEELEIHRGAYWIWSLRPAQSTLAAGILSLRRLSTAFGDVTKEEMADLAAMISLIEDRLAGTFKPAKINYLMLMMVDAHVHFHVLPRYPDPVIFAGHSWTDEGWPALPGILNNPDFADTAMLSTLRDTLKG